MDIFPTHREYLDTDLALSQEKVQQLSTVAVAHVNALVTELRRLFLVEDLVDSIKFGVVLYCLTYVGAIFNGMTCVIIGKKEKLESLENSYGLFMLITTFSICRIVHLAKGLREQQAVHRCLLGAGQKQNPRSFRQVSFKLLVIPRKMRKPKDFSADLMFGWY